MGKIAQGILDGVSGKVGNVIGASWKGIDYLRIKPAHINNPNTKLQQEQRNRFRGITQFAKSILDPVIRPIWNPVAVRMTGFNLFTQTNIDAFDKTGVIQDYSLLKMSKGSLPLPREFKITKDDDNPRTILINWDNASTKEDKKALDDDELNLIIMDESDKENEIKLFLNVSTRSVSSISLDTEIAAGSKISIYPYFKAHEKSMYSDSRHNSVEL